MPPSLAARVVILINNPYVADSRAWKIATSLGRAGYDVTVVAREGDGLAARQELEHHRVVRVAQPRPLARLPVPRLPGGGEMTPTGRAAKIRARVRDTAGRGLQAGRYLLVARAWARAIGDEIDGAEIWQAENIITLPVAVALRRRMGGRLVYDANDIDTEAGRMARLPKSWRRLLSRRERMWARSVDALVTVSDPYAEILSRSLQRTVDAIVRNGPPRFEVPEPPERRFHAALGLSPETRIVLHLGQVMDGRGIDELCAAMALVEGAVLVVAGFGADYERYSTTAAALPHADRIRFMGGVSPEEIPSWNASADVAAMPVQADTLNHRLNTPTKLFDAIGAGVPVVASDLPGIAPLVTETGIGELCDPTDPLDIARAINAILGLSTPEREALRDRCLAAARGPYSWERQAETLISIYAGLGVPPPQSGGEPG